MRRELPRSATEIAAEVGSIASAGGAIEERAQALLDPLRRVAPFQEAWIATLNPDRNGFTTLVVPADSKPGGLEIVRNATAVEGAERIGLHSSTRPVRGGGEVPLWQNTNWVSNWPSGYRDELALGLHVDGLPVGAMALLSESRTAFTQPVQNLIGLLAPMISHLVDPMRSVAALAHWVQDARAGIVVTSTGAPLPLPGLPGHPLLAPGSPVLSVVNAALAAGDQRSSFLCMQSGSVTARNLVRITVLGVPPSAVGLSAAVTVSDPGDRCGLTVRELQILGLVIEGWCNRQIARQLMISTRTVAAHIEHILTKLAASTRTEAAVRGLRRQLYIPAALTTTGPDRDGRA